jgi:cellulose synthase/poly-beta-1,6-N-acetylglucosamine synthase-like glycosyltransferase
MTSCLLNQVVYLLGDVILLPMLEFHATQLVVDSLNNDLCSLVKLLSSLFLTFFSSVFYELHQFFFLKFPREFTLSINLVVLLFPMMSISFKNIFNYLFTSSSQPKRFFCQQRLLARIASTLQQVLDFIVDFDLFRCFCVVSIS